VYGVIISLAILIATFIAEKLAKKDNKDTNIIWQGLTWLIISGVAGARIYHVLDLHTYYETQPLQILAIWRGGLGIYGAILGGFVGIFVYLKKNKQPILDWLDIGATVLPLAQAIGRWGNFVNRELYGSATTLPWGIYINNQKVHPLFLYESLLNFLLFGSLMYFWQKVACKKPGQIFAFYLIGYGSIRLVLENFRLDAWNIYNINVAQGISVILVALGLGFLCHLKMYSKK